MPLTPNCLKDEISELISKGRRQGSSFRGHRKTFQDELTRRQF